MKTTVTIQGDTWDVLSLRMYGNELYMDKLINANIEHRKVAIFPAGIVLQVPEIDTTVLANDDNLPPWKRQEGM